MSDPTNPETWIVTLLLIQTVFSGIIVYGMQQIIDLLEKRDKP